jgi:tetratricopeptide (TPR) repeat protein
MPKRFVRTVVICFLALALASIATPKPAFADQQQDCIQHADLDLQVRACSEILQRDASAAWAYVNRSWALMDKGELDRAVSDATKAIELAPNMAVAYANRAGALLGKGENDRAIADTTKAIELDPKQAIAFVNRATAYVNKADYDRAIADYDAAIKLDANIAFAYNGRGWAYRNKGDIDRAIADYSEAIRLNPKFTVAYINRTDANSTKGDFDQVIADATEAIRIDPKSFLAFNNRGLAHKAKNDHDRAVADFDQAIKLQPSFALAYVNRGFARAATGDQDRAMADYDEALRIDPKMALALNNRGWGYHLRGDHDRAVADFSRAIEIDPKMALAYANRGTAYTAMGDNARALADFRKILELPALTVTDRQRQEIARERIARLVQPPAPPKAAPPSSGPRRVALVIGNSKYTHAGLLTNPANDGRAVAGSLRRLGFTEVIEQYDMSRDKMGRALRDFGDSAEGAEWAVVFFAGHGIEVNGTSYLIPVDAELKRESHVSDEAVSLTQVQAKVDAASKLGLVILDSCRNNPFLTRMVRSATTRSLGRGLSPVEPEGNVLVVYSAKHGTTAEDGIGNHSPFTEALLAHIEEPGLEINFLFRRVRDRVREKTAKRQEPFLYGTLGSEQLFFKVAQAK